MRAAWVAGLVAAIGVGCTDVKVAQRGGCWVRETHSFPSVVREEIGPCARPPPQWSNDRVARLVQECMAEADFRWQSEAMEAWNKGQPLPAHQSEKSVMDACMGQAATSVVVENEALRKRVADLDVERARLAQVAQEEREHLRLAQSQMTEALGEAAKKPATAAYASSTSAGTASSQQDPAAQPLLVPTTTNITLPSAPVPVIATPPAEASAARARHPSALSACVRDSQGRPVDGQRACVAPPPRAETDGIRFAPAQTGGTDSTQRP